MALLGSREGEGVPETTDVNIETALMAMGDEDLQAVESKHTRSVWAVQRTEREEAGMTDRI